MDLAIESQINKFNDIVSQINSLHEHNEKIIKAEKELVFSSVFNEDNEDKFVFLKNDIYETINNTNDLTNFFKNYNINNYDDVKKLINLNNNLKTKKIYFRSTSTYPANEQFQILLKELIKIIPDIYKNLNKNENFGGKKRKTKKHGVGIIGKPNVIIGAVKKIHIFLYNKTHETFPHNVVKSLHFEFQYV